MLTSGNDSWLLSSLQAYTLVIVFFTYPSLVATTGVLRRVFKMLKEDARDSKVHIEPACVFFKKQKQKKNNKNKNKTEQMQILNKLTKTRLFYVFFASV